MLALLRANPLVSALGGLGVILALLLAIQSVRLGHERNVSERLRINLNEVRAERDSLIAAAKEAERLNQEQVSRIVNEQDRISNERQADLSARLERLRRELRGQAPKGSAGSAPASPDGKAPGGADGPPAMCLSSEELLRAAEDEERHDQLITWIEEQLKVAR